MGQFCAIAFPRLFIAHRGVTGLCHNGKLH